MVVVEDRPFIRRGTDGQWIAGERRGDAIGGQADECPDRRLVAARRALALAIRLRASPLGGKLRVAVAEVRCLAALHCPSVRVQPAGVVLPRRLHLFGRAPVRAVAIPSWRPRPEPGARLGAGAAGQWAAGERGGDAVGAL